MNEYLIQQKTLINIADPLRSIFDVDTKWTPAQIAEKITEINNYILAQSYLISKIQAALAAAGIDGNGQLTAFAIVDNNNALHDADLSVLWNVETMEDVHELPQIIANSTNLQAVLDTLRTQPIYLEEPAS